MVTMQEFLQTLDISVCRDALKKMYSNNGGVELLKAIIQGDGGDAKSPEPSINNLPWCKCGRCRPMPQDVENVCCRNWFCVTLENFLSLPFWTVNDWQLHSVLPPFARILTTSCEYVIVKRNKLG